jgi:hypothetical protein
LNVGIDCPKFPIRAQTEQALAVHNAQVEQQQAQNAAIHLQVKTRAEIELAKIKADLDAKLKILDAHINVAARKPSQVPGARKAKRWPSLSPRPEAGGQISDGRSPWLIIRWSRSTISPTLTGCRWCRSSMIRSAPMVLFSRRRLSPQKPTRRCRRSHEANRNRRITIRTRHQATITQPLMLRPLLRCRKSIRRHNVPDGNTPGASITNGLVSVIIRTRRRLEAMFIHPIQATAC